MSRRIDVPVKRGRQVRNLSDLKEAAMVKQAVITRFNLMMPAGWVFQMQGQKIHEYIRSGLYIYKGRK